MAIPSNEVLVERLDALRVSFESHANKIEDMLHRMDEDIKKNSAHRQRQNVINTILGAVGGAILTIVTWMITYFPGNGS